VSGDRQLSTFDWWCFKLKGVTTQHTIPGNKPTIAARSPNEFHSRDCFKSNDPTTEQAVTDSLRGKGQSRGSTVSREQPAPSSGPKSQFPWPNLAPTPA